jgi:hypothetical protein
VPDGRTLHHFEGFSFKVPPEPRGGATARLTALTGDRLVGRIHAVVAPAQERPP